jgi:hypothetical protein
MIAHHPTFPSESARLYAQNQADPAYCIDMAAKIDRPEEILAEDLGITLAVALKVIAHTQNEVRKSQALILGKIVGMLLETSNLPVLSYALACAAGLDQLNGKKSQAKIAEELGVTRALVSHYVLGVRDVLSGKRDTFDCIKFRKSQSSRKIFREKATDPFLAAKRAAIQRKQNQQKTPCN